MATRLSSSRAFFTKQRSVYSGGEFFTHTHVRKALPYTGNLVCASTINLIARIGTCSRPPPPYPRPSASRPPSCGQTPVGFHVRVFPKIQNSGERGPCYSRRGSPTFPTTASLSERPAFAATSARMMILEVVIRVVTWNLKSGRMAESPGGWRTFSVICTVPQAAQDANERIGACRTAELARRHDAERRWRSIWDPAGRGKGHG